MRIVTAMVKHETNTYSPVPSPLERFGRSGPVFGDQNVIDAYSGTNTAIGGFIDLCKARGFELSAPVAAAAAPSGPVPDAVFDSMVVPILDAVRQGCDAVLLDLHGAMVTESHDDAEGELLRRIRAIAPDVPIAVALDLHAHISAQMIALASCISGYRTYPHIDVRETGERVAENLLQAMASGRPIALACARPGILAQTLCMDTAEQPMKTLMAAARGAEQGNVVDISVFGGFPLANVQDAGVAIVVASRNGDLAAAQQAADKLARLATELRDGFIYHAEALAESVQKAKRIAEGPVLLIDHCDNSASGGTQDVTMVLREVLQQGLSDVAVFAICDRPAVEQCIAAGAGAVIGLALGGKVPMPAIHREGEPLHLQGRVVSIHDGQFKITGPLFTGSIANLGRTVVFEASGAQIVICERQYEPWDLGCFRAFGIEPTEKKYLLLKSRIHYRAAFAPIAKAIVECNGEGVTSSDYSLFPYSKLQRPVFPLDAGM